MQAGDIIFVRGHSPISRIIKLLDGEFSHVAIAVSDTHIFEAQRFTKSRITTLYFDDYEVLSLRLDKNNQERVRDLAKLMCGYKYDYWQVFGFLIEKLFGFDRKNFMNSKDRYICSELIDIILFLLEIIPYNDYIGDLTPNELYRHLLTIESVDKYGIKC